MAERVTPAAPTFVDETKKPNEEDPNLETVPLSEFTKDNLLLHLHNSMSSTLLNLGLECHQQAPDFNAISDFFGQRYNYWTDDIEHPDFGL